MVELTPKPNSTTISQNAGARTSAQNATEKGDSPGKPPPRPNQPHIALGDWLSGGWQVYKENGALLSTATLLAAVLGTLSVGILAGPMLMGLFRMAFKTMRGERPEIGDLFNWQGRFVQAFLTFLIFALVHAGLTGLGNNSVHGLLSLVVTPLLTMMLGLTMSSIAERGLDVAKAINEVWRLIFTRDALMWWVAGLVFAAIGGVCSLVLPPYLTKGGLPQPAYGWPLIPWFAIAWANARMTVSMVCFFVLGSTLGLAQPRRWLLLAGVAMAVPPALLAVNILYDWTHDATSHNLFPFEFLIYAFISLPALIGALLGFLARRFFRRRLPAA